jgi:hypothetical protein
MSTAVTTPITLTTDVLGRPVAVLPDAAVDLLRNAAAQTWHNFPGGWYGETDGFPANAPAGALCACIEQACEGTPPAGQPGHVDLSRVMVVAESGWDEDKHFWLNWHGWADGHVPGGITHDEAGYHIAGRPEQ